MRSPAVHFRYRSTQCATVCDLLRRANPPDTPWLAKLTCSSCDPRTHVYEARLSFGAATLIRESAALPRTMQTRGRNVCGLGSTDGTPEKMDTKIPGPESSVRPR